MRIEKIYVHYTYAHIRREIIRIWKIKRICGYPKRISAYPNETAQSETKWPTLLPSSSTSLHCYQEAEIISEQFIWQKHSTLRSNVPLAIFSSLLEPCCLSVPIASGRKRFKPFQEEGGKSSLRRELLRVFNNAAKLW